MFQVTIGKQISTFSADDHNIFLFIFPFAKSAAWFVRFNTFSLFFFLFFRFLGHL